MKAEDAMKQISEIVDGYIHEDLTLIRCVSRIAAVVGRYENES